MCYFLLQSLLCLQCWCTFMMKTNEDSVARQSRKREIVDVDKNEWSRRRRRWPFSHSFRLRRLRSSLHIFFIFCFCLPLSWLIVFTEETRGDADVGQTKTTLFLLLFFQLQWECVEIKCPIARSNHPPSPDQTLFLFCPLLFSTPPPPPPQQQFDRKDEPRINREPSPSWPTG